MLRRKTHSEKFSDLPNANQANEDQSQSPYVLPYKIPKLDGVFSLEKRVTLKPCCKIPALFSWQGFGILSQFLFMEPCLSLL